MNNLNSAYRPRRLSDVLGQPAAVKALRLFLKAPYTGAFLFHGESGVGKTSAAYAVAVELGVDVQNEELGGLYDIASGDMTADSVRRRMDSLRLRPLWGSGWKVLICNEADRMSPAAETVWLDSLEHLPQQSVIIFTTNEPHRLSRRLRDRCENVAFTCDPDALRKPIQALAKRVWQEMVGRRKKMPRLPDLGMPTLGDVEHMHASFRLALHQLGRYIREATHGRADFDSVRTLSADSDCYLKGTQKVAAECDHCGQENSVPLSRTRHVCDHCGKAFKLTWE